MRIGLDTQAVGPRKTGIGQYTYSLLAALRQIAPEHEYVELSPGGPVALRTDRRVWWQQIGLPQRARATAVDVLHVTGFDAPIWKPCPVVLTVHDLIPRLFPRNLPPISRLYWARWLPATVRFADMVIADSESTRRDIIRLLRVPERRVEVIPLGVGEQFTPQSQQRVAECRAKYGLAQPFILFVSTLEPRKGIDTLIDAFIQLAPDHACDLVLAGKPGWYWQPILERIERSGLGARIRRLDYVPDSDLPALYTAASVLALPSRYEGFGFPVLEAMACGTPVVCSNTSSLPEVAGDAGLLVPPDDPSSLAEALALVLSNEPLAATVRAKGLLQAARFTWEKTARATLQVYAQTAVSARVPR